MWISSLELAQYPWHRIGWRHRVGRVKEVD